MPKVVVEYFGSLISNRALVSLGDSLPSIVAEALNVPERPEGLLAEKDIEIEFKDITDNPKHHLNRHSLALQITILANDYPERKANLEERKDEIISEIKKKEILHEENSLGGPENGMDLYGRCFVWVLLAPGAFGSF